MAKRTAQSSKVFIFEMKGESAAPRKQSRLHFCPRSSIVRHLGVMRRLLQLVLVLFGFCSAGIAAEKNTEVKLLLSHSAARPGETITAGLQMVSKPGWHTYWKNPGDAGLPATIEWQLPQGM